MESEANCTRTYDYITSTNINNIHFRNQPVTTHEGLTNSPSQIVSQSLNQPREGLYAPGTSCTKLADPMLYCIVLDIPFTKLICCFGLVPELVSEDGLDVACAVSACTIKAHPTRLTQR